VNKKALANFLPDLTFTLNYNSFVIVINLKFIATGNWLWMSETIYTTEPSEWYVHD
jgi:hypothetical protein